MNHHDELKRAAACAAMAYVRGHGVIGVGTGSTVNFFIAELGKIRIEGAVASSEASARLLTQSGIRVIEMNNAPEIPVYVDGADEVTSALTMIKGGGGALTREKILASAARKFVCIADESKLKETLGDFPVAIEILPMAREFVCREIAKLKGQPKLREGFTTDNGNAIIDVRGFDFSDPLALETALDQIPGVVANGIFARRRADVLLLARRSKVDTIAS
ncbi:MAG: ribose-5-phosphate isomerase RpiA [Burkholderiales bacterium]